MHLAREEHTIEQIENFQAPKKLKADDNEEVLCVLPVRITYFLFALLPTDLHLFTTHTHTQLEYYDNEDGFWTEFIREKYNRNHNSFPVTHSRPFFKH